MTLERWARRGSTSRSRDLINLARPGNPLGSVRTELTDEVAVRATALLGTLQELARPRPSDCTQVPGQLVLAHTDTRVYDKSVTGSVSDRSCPYP
jgi:hypothetical protein